MANETYRITIEPVSAGTQKSAESTISYGSNGKWKTMPAGRREFVLSKTGADNDTTKEQVVQMIQGIIVAYHGNQALGGDPTAAVVLVNPGFSSLAQAVSNAAALA